MEKGLKWFYDTEGGQDVGPNDPIHQKFKGNPYYSIVRESIQNSLDAVQDHSKPVIVKFKYFELDRRDFPELFSIENHIILCKEYFPTNEQAKKMLDEMLTYLNGNEKGKKRLKIPCLKISDFNTEGMEYTENDTNSRFYTFFKISGLSTKQVGSGGSFGFGKGAYYALSPIKTIIVSTKDQNSNHYFEGSTRLTTHFDENKRKITAYGYYDKGDGKPVSDQDLIPDIFIRNETGTDVNIIGLQEDKFRLKSMIKSVLNNFWPAIYYNQLSVTIDNTEINHSNLERTIQENFQGQLESGSANDYESWNPMSYYKAMKFADQSSRYSVFTKNLPTLGKVDLMVYRDNNLPNRIAYVRKPKMVVFKQTRRKLNGYSAVFCCFNEQGNEILRQMENPEHNEWKKENYLTDGIPDRKAKKAEIEIRDFISESLDELALSGINQTQSFLGLEEFLSIPEDLIGKDEDLMGGDQLGLFGDLSDDATNEETAYETTTNSEIVIKPLKTKTPKLLEDFSGDITSEGEESIVVGGSNSSTGGDQPSTTSSKSAVDGQVGDQLAKRAIQIQYRVAAQMKDDKLYHHLIIHTRTPVDNAELSISIGTDNDNSSVDNQINILSSSKGICDKSLIKNLGLIEGRNQIDVVFEDHTKHSIKINAYER